MISACPSKLYLQRFRLKICFIEKEQLLKPGNSLVKNFIEKILELLDHWEKDNRICGGCNAKINE